MFGVLLRSTALGIVPGTRTRAKAVITDELFMTPGVPLEGLSRRVGR